MQFARDPAKPTAASDLIAALHPEASQPLWLLVDAALIDQSKLRTWAAGLHWNASDPLQGSPFESFGKHGPRLFALPDDRDAATLGLHRLINVDPQAPAVSLIASATQGDELARLAAYLAQVQIDGDLFVHCRFADTRVLPELLRALSPRQAQRVARSVGGWSWVDHLGAVGRWRPVATEAAAPEADPSSCLTLDQRQFAAMLGASEPDNMFLLLLETTPELVPDSGQGQLRDRLTSILERADRRHLESPNDRLQFVILSLSCGDAFHDHSDLQPTWAAIAQRRATLVDEMKNWSDSLWELLQSRKPE